ncbi:MAG TPA: universal stress protein, partial [Gaiellaceae bacterium]|nr:universal stress protein [Gaiellaceae bacterium]
YALGLTPLVFVLAGVIFAATAATYAEGTARFPEAGGSASFARHAFDELVSFTAGWAQMLVYVVTVAVSAFFVPHYLSIFWEPLRTNPWDIVGGAVVIVVLVVLNVVGVQEAAKLSISLAVVDFATQVLLVVVGFALVLSPETLVDNVHWGVAPTWGNLAIAIPVAMLAYTGVETVSNLAEEARDPVRTVPNAYKLVAGAVFAIYFTLPLVALSALPVERIDGELTTLLALPPEQGGYANDPILGVVENIGLEGRLLDVAEVYVGILAATILVIATNAGVIGASRITYSMATYRQLPEALRRLHPRFKTPWLSLVLFAGVAPILLILPGDVNFIGTLYSLGATLSFTIAHASLIRLRAADLPDAEIPYLARPNLRMRGRTWPLFAFVGGLATGASFLVLVFQNPLTRWVGLGWMAAGLVGYVVYRRRFLQLPVRAVEKAPPALGPALALEYRDLLVPVIPGQPSDAAMDVACRLAAERRARIIALNVVEVPLDRPVTDRFPDLEATGNAELDEAVAIGDSYGVRVLTRLDRAHAAGPAIVAEADARNAEIIVLGSPRRNLTARQTAVFGKTVDYVLKHASCRVMIAAEGAAG